VLFLVFRCNTELGARCLQTAKSVKPSTPLDLSGMLGSGLCIAGGIIFLAVVSDTSF